MTGLRPVLARTAILLALAVTFPAAAQEEP